MFEGIHIHERVALAYFCYLAALSLFYPIAPLHRLAILAVPIAIYALIRLETAFSRPGSRLLRQWASLAVILVAYRMLAWFAATPSGRYEPTWVRWDEQLLTAFRLSQMVEIAGWIGPALLEWCYLLVYAIAPFSLGILYLCGAGKLANRYLMILFLGTFTAYALVPFFPVAPPRQAFPASVPPPFHGVARSFNIFLLDRFNVAIAVFPSGHVALALSSALGLFEALRDRTRIWGFAFLLALLVFIATVYGRYHYAVDGLASIFVGFFVWRASRVWRTIEV